MKKTLLASTLILTAASLCAQDSPVAQWGAYLYGGTTVAQGNGIAIGKDGKAYWLNNIGTTESKPNVMLNNDALFQGELYNSGTSATGNLTLLCTTPDGEKQWMIYSTSGDYASNQGAIATDSNGNIVFTAKVRHGDFLDTPINIIDAQGNKTEFGGAVAQKSYALLVAKASADGNLLWHKYITLSTTPGEGASKDFISDAVKSTALAIDDNDNIYVGGNFSADMTVADGVTLKANNISTWSGDSQTASGSYFILKYNADGDYLTSATGNDGLSQSQTLNLLWDNGALYFYGNATGENGTLTLGGRNIAIGAYQTPVLAKLGDDLHASWARSLVAGDVSGTCVLQYSNISVSGSILWFCGMFNGVFSDAEGSDKTIASVGKTPREGALIKFDALTGEWLAGTTSRAGNFTPTATANNGLQGYLSVLQNPQKPEKCYVYGYVMNAAVGIFLREYDATSLTPNLDHAWSIATQGGTPTATNIAYDKTNNTAFVSGRGNKAYSLLAEPAIETINPGAWSVLLAKYDMPADLKQETSAITDINAENTDVPSVYYNLQGIPVNEGQLVPGVYIRVQGQNSEKILIR